MHHFPAVASPTPLPGARDLLAYLTGAAVSWAIATSGRIETAGPVLEVLGVNPRVPMVARDQVKHAKRERMVIRLRHLVDGDGATLKQLGEELGHSNEGARQIEVRALEKLRDALLRLTKLPTCFQPSGTHSDGRHDQAQRAGRVPDLAARDIPYSIHIATQ
jgi:hypothetical protein